MQSDKATVDPAEVARFERVARETLEYLLRLATAPLQPELRGKRFARVRYFFSFYALVDLVAIAPFYFASLVPVTDFGKASAI